MEGNFILKSSLHIKNEYILGKKVMLPIGKIHTW